MRFNRLPIIAVMALAFLAQPAYAVQLLCAPYCAFYDASGLPLNGGKVYTYSAGTTTPKATYTDSGAGTPLSNPVILDSAGRKAIWLNGSYKITVKDSLDNTIQTVDNVSSQTATGDMLAATYDPANIAQQVTGTSAVQTLTNKTLTTPTINQPTINGVTNAGSAPSGAIGEYLSSTITSGSAVSLSNGVAANITSLSLTAGDWDVSASIVFGGGATTNVFSLQGSVSSTSATMDGTPGRAANMSGQNTTFFNTYLTNPVIQLPPIRINVASTTTYYLVALSTFTTSTCSAFGTIHARRVH